jgi:hypothetical protein
MAAPPERFTAVLEEDLRTLFRLQSDGDMPASFVSVPAAGLRARAARRRRRAVVIGSPLLAAAAVLAVVASATLLRTTAGGAPGPSTPGPQHLDPTRSYASFGWLPGAMTSENGGTSRTEMWLDASTRRLDVSLSVYSAGRCRLQPAASGHRAELSCAGGVGKTGESAPVTGEAEVRGHQAYVVTLGPGVSPAGGAGTSARGKDHKPAASAGDHFLAWQYARDSWAVLEYYALREAVALRIADHARAGVVTGRVKFPAQLTGVPPAWRIGDVAFTLQAGVLAASLYQLTAGPRNLAPAGAGYPVNMPAIAIGPPQAARYCTLPGVPVTHRLINRYEVLVQNDSASRPPQEQLCATDAGGLSVAMYVIGSHPVLSVAAIFSHMRLLGPDPGHWTVRPLG